MHSAPRRFIAVSLLLFALALSAGCSDPADPGGEPPRSETVEAFIAGLPAWSSYAPAGPEQDSIPANAPDTSDVVVPLVERVVDGGAVDTLLNVPYVCVTDTVTWSKNPDELIMYSPSADILWPGALIQGRSYRSGGLEGLPIQQRAPLRVSIPALRTADNFRVVDVPNESTVGSAIGAMIGDATDRDLQVGATTTFKMETYHSERAFALSMNASGRYFWFSARVGGSTSRSASETTVTVHYAQKMFEVIVGQPQTPAEFFSSAFTQARLDEQVRLGNIGADNPPVYVATVNYGRMMAFSLTSTASASEIKATLQASYNALGSGASVQLSPRQRELLRRSTIKITSIGGDDSATTAMIRSGDWRAYFTQTAKLSTASPLSYTFKTLGGQTAKVWETTRYPVQTCQPRAQVPGPFRFLESQDVPVPIATPYSVLMADVNGDGRSDIVFNHLSATVNELAVAVANATGGFEAPVRIAHGQPVPSPEGWTRYSLQAGDVTGDGRADLVWHSLDRTWRVYVGVAEAGGGFSFPYPTQHYENLGSEYSLHLADLDRDGAKDLVWNRTISGSNRTYIGKARGDGSFDVDSYYPPFDNPRGSGWGSYDMRVTDLNGDGRDDLLWNIRTDHNQVYPALTRTDTLAFNFYTAERHPTSCCWYDYQPLLGDFNGDNNVDLFWAQSVVTAAGVYQNGVHGAMGEGNGRFRFKAHQKLSVDSAGNPGRGPFRVLALDVDGDGVTDLVWNRLDGSGNRVAVLRGVRNSDMLDTSDAAQQHPDPANWLQAVPLTGDVNGDGRGDVVWLIPGGSTRVYVALGKQPNT